MEDNFDIDKFLMLDSDQLDEYLNEGRTEDQIKLIEIDKQLDGVAKYDIDTFNKEVEEFVKMNPEAIKDVKKIKRMIEEQMMKRGSYEDEDEDEEGEFDWRKYEIEQGDEFEYDKYKKVDIKQQEDSDEEDDENDEDDNDNKDDSDEMNQDDDDSIDDEDRNPFSMIFVNEEDMENESDYIFSKSPVDGELKPNKYQDIFNGDMISSKKGLDDLHFKKIDFSSGEEVQNLSLGFQIEEDEEGNLVQEKDKENEDDEDEEEGLENENPFHPDNLFDMGQYEDADVDRYKKMITDLRNPESGPMFIYMGACWMGGALAGTIKGFKKSLFRTPKRGWDRIFECFEYSKPIIERSSNLALRVGAVIGVSQLGLSFFFETNEYTKITSFGLGMLTYYKSFHPDLISKTKMLTFFGLFSACCISMHQLRRTFNGYNGSEPLITFLSLTTHNPFIRYFLDVKLGITDFFFPNFYGETENFNITTPFDLPVTTKHIQLLDATPKLQEEDL